MNFEELGLDEIIVKAVNKMGFVEPSEIQSKAVPELLKGTQDFVGLAQTGTGKTAAFGLPMIHLVDFGSIMTQGLVICPTRELCVQVTGDFKAFSKYIKGSNVVSVYGGASIENQIRAVKKGAQIIVATPGRLIDLMKRKVVNLKKIKYVVLDEADEMLNMGFQDDIEKILSDTPDNKSTWLFSATMPSTVANIARKYMAEPVKITIGKKNSGAENIEHHKYIIKESDRYAALKRLIDFYPDIFGLIFCRTRKDTHQIAEKLIRDGYNAEALHGDLSQAQRENVMKRFRNKNIQILVATDVAARGLDVNDITHVIHYNLPDEPEVYTHRSGRTARAGKKGVSIALLNTRENRKIFLIEKRTGVSFEYKKVPFGYAICEKQLFSMIKALESVEVDQAEIETFLPSVYETLSGHSREDLIQRFISLEFNRFIRYYKNAGDLNAKNSVGKKSNTKSGNKKSRKNSYGADDRGASSNTYRRFFVNAGKLDSLNKGAVTRLICENAGVSSGSIGKIEILREFSFFEIDKKFSEKVLKSLRGVQFDGRKIVVQYAGKKKR